MNTRVLSLADQRRIHDEIQRHQEAIASLRRQQNTLAPISILPPEMLYNVFYFVVFAHRNNLGNPCSDHHGVPTWISQLSHVCQHWRNVALKSPELWTELPLEHRKWTEVMLERSRTANVTVNVPFVEACRKKTVSTDIATLELAMAHWKRIEYLCLRGIPKDVYLSLQNRWPESVPNLQSLTITVKTPWSFDMVECLPATSFADSTCLHAVHLSNIMINWSMAIFQANLTELRIDGSLEHVNSIGTLNDLRSALQKTPHLVLLELNGLLPSLGKPRNFTAIPLKRLRTLILRGPGQIIALIFQIISYPPLDCLHVYFLGNEDASLAKAIEHMDPEPSLDPSRYPISITDLHLSTAEGRTFIIEGLFAGTSRTHFTLKGTTEMNLDSSLSVILSALPLHHVISFDANINYSKLYTWIDHISGLPQLETVRVFDDFCSARLVEALRRGNPHPTNTTSGGDDIFATAYFPKLRKLHFKNDFQGDLSVNKLVKALIHRRKMGVEIRKLQLKRCTHLPGGDVDRLKKLVTDIDWDGDEGFTDSYDEDDEDDDEDYEDYYDEL